MREASSSAAAARPSSASPRTAAGLRPRGRSRRRARPRGAPVGRPARPRSPGGRPRCRAVGARAWSFAEGRARSPRSSSSSRSIASIANSSPARATRSSSRAESRDESAGGGRRYGRGGRRTGGGGDEVADGRVLGRGRRRAPRRRLRRRCRPFRLLVGRGARVVPGVAVSGSGSSRVMSGATSRRAAVMVSVVAAVGEGGDPGDVLLGGPRLLSSMRAIMRRRRRPLAHVQCRPDEALAAEAVPAAGDLEAVVAAPLEAFELEGPGD